VNFGATNKQSNPDRVVGVYGDLSYPSTTGDNVYSGVTVRHRELTQNYRYLSVGWIEPPGIGFCAVFFGAWKDKFGNIDNFTIQSGCAPRYQTYNYGME